MGRLRRGARQPKPIFPFRSIGEWGLEITASVALVAKALAELKLAATQAFVRSREQEILAFIVGVPKTVALGDGAYQHTFSVQRTHVRTSTLVLGALHDADMTDCQRCRVHREQGWDCCPHFVQVPLNFIAEETARQREIAERIERMVRNLEKEASRP